MAYGIAGSGTTPVLYPSGGTANTLQATGFIPEIWSGKLVQKFYATTVLGGISNTDYEGEIKGQGDKVKIRTKPTITIRDYLADGDLAIDRPSGSVVDLTIDQGKYFNLILDDVMEIQSDLNLMSMWSDDASEQFKITVDTAVLKGILNGATATTNRGAAAGKISAAINLGATTVGAAGTPLAATAAAASGKVDILTILLRLGQVLDEQNIPETGRWVVLPTWASVLLKQSELRQAYLSGDGVSILRNGRIGMVDRFTIYTSNLLPSGTTGGLAAGEYVIYAGHAHGLTFASQFTKMETIRSERTFGSLLRGLQVYGYKVIDGTALTQAIVTQG
jgi:hypothetical protein